MVKVLALAALLAGCSQATLGDDGAGAADANGSNGNTDSNMQVQTDAPAPACANGRKLFLEFLGATLTDAGTSDATTNTARWLTNASAVIPPFRQNGANRAQQITEIVDGVKQRLSATPIDVVTARPASGPYVMVVLGGANTNNGGTVGTIYSYATGHHDCGDATKSDVGWVSDMTPATVSTLGADASTELIADLVVGAVGWGLGLNGTTDTADCMCGWATNCTSAGTACTLSTSIASSIAGTTETACPNQNPQNEAAAFTTTFCQ